MEFGGRWRTESRGGDGWSRAPSPPMNEEVNNSSRCEGLIKAGGRNGFSCCVGVSSFFSEYRMEVSQQNLPPKFLIIILTYFQRVKFKGCKKKKRKGIFLFLLGSGLFGILPLGFLLAPPALAAPPVTWACLYSAWKTEPKANGKAQSIIHRHGDLVNRRSRRPSSSNELRRYP